MANGHALLNVSEPLEKGAVTVTGWRADTKSLVATTILPNGAYHESVWNKITEETMEGMQRGTFMGAPYEGTSVARKIDDDHYETEFKSTLPNGSNFTATTKLSRVKQTDE